MLFVGLLLVIVLTELAKPPFACDFTVTGTEMTHVVLSKSGLQTSLRSVSYKQSLDPSNLMLSFPSTAQCPRYDFGSAFVKCSPYGFLKS